MDNELPVVKKTFYSTVVKRLLDIILSGSALIILLPLLLLVCILELIFHGWPIFYCAKRPGKDGKIFKMYKFRSMTNERGPDGYLLPEEKRLTRFGYTLRKTSIDELPGIWCILCGYMSVVGPRPLLIEYLPYYSPRHAMRHAVRPGLMLENITGNGKEIRTWREQFENDIWYIEHISFLTDIKMLFAILKAVLRGSETRASDTRVPFDGTNLDETRSKEELGIQTHFASLQ